MFHRVNRTIDTHDGFGEAISLAYQGHALAYQGDTAAARAAADAAVEAAAELGPLSAGNAYWALAFAALAAGDAATARDATEAAGEPGADDEDRGARYSVPHSEGQLPFLA